MIKLIKTEFKKAFNYKFYIVLCAFTILLLFGLYKYQFINPSGIFETDNAFHGWFYSIEEGSFHIIENLAALIVVIPFGDSLFSEFSNGYARMICTRVNFKEYIKAKYFVNSIMAFLTIVIPNLVLFITSLIIHKATIPNDKYWNPHGELMGLYFSSPILYILFCILIMGIFAIVYSSLSFAISFYSKYRTIVLLFPFLIYTAFQFFCDFNNLISIQPRLSLMYYLESCHFLIIYIIEYTVILIISFLLIKSKLKEKPII